MPQYIVLSRLTTEGRKVLKEKPARLKEVNKEITKMGAKVLQQYALLGKYDFLNIMEAPDNETVAKVMVELGSRGTLETTTLAAIPIDDFLKALKG
ncbi:MAG: GYD domain-containing protein [Methanomassiliicoccales archaeon]|nr:GYD domain-containing protein [Methanomassiliicoccales archaeon]